MLYASFPRPVLLHEFFIKKNQNAPRPSEPSQGGKMSKRLGGIKGCKYKNIFMAFSYIITIIILGSLISVYPPRHAIRSTSTLQCIYHLCSIPFVVYKTVNDKLHTGMAAQSSNDSPLYCTLNNIYELFHIPSSCVSCPQNAPLCLIARNSMCGRCTLRVATPFPSHTSRSPSVPVQHRSDGRQDQDAGAASQLREPVGPHRRVSYFFRSPSSSGIGVENA